MFGSALLSQKSIHFYALKMRQLPGTLTFAHFSCAFSGFNAKRFVSYTKISASGRLRGPNETTGYLNPTKRLLYLLEEIQIHVFHLSPTKKR